MTWRLPATRLVSGKLEAPGITRGNRADWGQMSVQQIVVFTDGASKRNPGAGGWGVVIVTPDGHVTELGGGEPLTTNHKMELTGAIQALTRLQATPGPVAVYTDSTCVIQGIEHRCRV